MRRREFITLIGGAAVAHLVLWPLAARAQQAAMPVVGFLSPWEPGAQPHFLAAFRQGLNDAGYVEGRNVAMEYRFAENQYDRLPALADDLVRRQVAVIAAPGSVAVQAARRATATIPIVFVTGGDPVQLGLVASLNRPGGSLTGATRLAAELAPKRLELMHELVPTAGILAVLVNPINPTVEPMLKDLQAAAGTLGVRLQVLHAGAERDFKIAFTSLQNRGVGGLLIASDGFLISQAETLGALAVQHGVPAIFQFREFAAAGGVMSYGDSSTEPFRQIGVYAGRILQGEKPADLPVQQTTKVELIINLKAAKALGITVPQSILLRADEVIE
jgi:putative ABC transport system substrate-binding protein